MLSTFPCWNPTNLSFNTLLILLLISIHIHTCKADLNARKYFNTFALLFCLSVSISLFLQLLSLLSLSLDKNSYFNRGPNTNQFNSIQLEFVDIFDWNQLNWINFHWISNFGIFCFRTNVEFNLPQMTLDAHSKSFLWLLLRKSSNSEMSLKICPHWKRNPIHTETSLYFDSLTFVCDYASKIVAIVKSQTKFYYFSGKSSLFELNDYHLALLVFPIFRITSYLLSCKVYRLCRLKVLNYISIVCAFVISSI